MELLKLIIVDDEQILLRGLVETYEWERVGFQIVGCALDGEDALTLIEKERPDVVLTDICMKRMGGIELMEKTKNIDPDIKFVVLSAYKDFEYAQEACRLGAVSYLLKPITDEMFNKMYDVYDICMEEKKKRRNYKKWENFLIEDEKSFCDYMLERYLQGGITKEELLSVGDAIVGHFENKNYFAAICVDVEVIYKITEQSEYNAKRCALDLILRKELKKYKEYWSFVNMDGSRVYIINVGENSGNGKLKLILAELPKKLGFDIISAMTNTYQGIDGLHQSYLQIQHLYNLANEEEVNLLEETGLESRKNKVYPLEAENRIISGIRRSDAEQVKRGCIDFVGVLSEDEETNKIFLHQLTVRVEIMLNDSYGLEEDIRKGFDEYYQVLSQYPSSRLVFILYRFFLMIIERRLQMVPKGEEEKYVSYIRRACDFMEENMGNEELSIVQVAETVYLNPVYFGRIFKAVKNIPFKQYLLKIRMEKAKQLLLDTPMTITDICEVVGIPNASYFAKLFKQYTGKLPSEYKR